MEEINRIHTKQLKKPAGANQYRPDTGGGIPERDKQTTSKQEKENKQMKANEANEKIYSAVTDKIIAQMEQGVIPWKK